MQRITTLLQNISELAENGNNGALEIDLMMDYTRQLYAELLMHKSHRSENIVDTVMPAIQHTDIPNAQIAQSPISQPTDDIPAGKPNIIELNIDNTTSTPPLPESAPDKIRDSIDLHIPPRDIRTFIGINDKYQIISELFSNKKDAYESMIDRLNTLDTELDALKWLQDNMYFEYSWSEDSEALMILHAILHKFYTK